MVVMGTAIPTTPASPAWDAAAGAAGGDDDAALVARARAGDDTAFGQLYARYRDAIYRRVRHLMPDPEDAAELTQDTFLKAWRALPATRDDTQFRRWLYTIATNVCRDAGRHRRLVRWTPWDEYLASVHPTQVAPSGGDDDPEATVLAAEAYATVGALLAGLPARWRRVLALRVADRSYPQLGAALGTTTTAAKSVLHQARVALRREWTAQQTRLGPPPSAPPPGPDPLGWRARRAALGLWQTAFAAAAGVSHNHYSAVEAGRSAGSAAFRARVERGFAGLELEAARAAQAQAPQAQEVAA